MKKATLYSRSPRTQARRAPASAASPVFADAAPASAQPSRTERAEKPPGRLRSALSRHPRSSFFAAGLCAALIGVVLQAALLQPAAQRLTQDDVDAAVLHTLETQALPSRPARAAAAVMPSVVRVRTGAPHERRPLDEPGHGGTGTGVVIVEDGTILTSLHVVAGAERITVTFFDGSESDAVLMSVRPESDLAVLRARRLPDDVRPATLRPAASLVPGDEVVAIGFPFGIGPSVSSGVVSGLGRQHRAEDERPLLSNLIQFDAAVNPGNSGGPLITMDGQVVGIVAAILNPTDQSFFVGIGLAVPIEDAAAAVGVPPA
ncbi:MAG: serine protease [Methylibium sp.]|nr:serine protease [Methylibium sp.]